MYKGLIVITTVTLINLILFTIVIVKINDSKDNSNGSTLNQNQISSLVQSYSSYSVQPGFSYQGYNYINFVNYTLYSTTFEIYGKLTNYYYQINYNNPIISKQLNSYFICLNTAVYKISYSGNTKSNIVIYIALVLNNHIKDGLYFGTDVTSFSSEFTFVCNVGSNFTFAVQPNNMIDILDDFEFAFDIIEFNIAD